MTVYLYLCTACDRIFIYAPHVTVYLVGSLPKLQYKHRIWFRPTLNMSQSNLCQCCPASQICMELRLLIITGLAKTIHIYRVDQDRIDIWSHVHLAKFLHEILYGYHVCMVLAVTLGVYVGTVFVQYFRREVTTRTQLYTLYCTIMANLINPLCCMASFSNVHYNYG